MKSLRTLFSILLLAAPAAAQHHPAEHDPGSHAAADEHAAHRKAAGAGGGEGLDVDVEVRDLELVDQFGKPARLGADVVGDRLAAITFIYTDCTTICPIYSALFQQTQELLGERLERDAVLVTMTLDPTTDVPMRLRREAARYRARPGWYFLTGDKPNVDEVLRGLDAYFADFTQHPPMALVGDGRTGTWKRINGFPEPRQIVRLMDELAAARGEGGGK